MKNIKKFESFVNERLDRSTYFSAAKQADEKGQRKLGNDLRTHSNELDSKSRHKKWDEKYGHLKKYEFNVIIFYFVFFIYKI